MSAIRFPIAASADEALAAQPRAARAREAAELAGGPVRFATEPASACYPTREAALDALAGRLDDDRPGRAHQVAAEDRYLAIAERIEGVPAPPPAEPAFADGRRWPKTGRRAGPKTVFRVMVSFWLTGAPAEAEPAPPGPQARQARRRADSAGLNATELRALAQAPMRPVKPQQPLDVGLFEAPIPEAPHMLIPDE